MLSTNCSLWGFTNKAEANLWAPPDIESADGSDDASVGASTFKLSEPKFTKAALKLGIKSEPEVEVESVVELEVLLSELAEMSTNKAFNCGTKVVSDAKIIEN